MTLKYQLASSSRQRLIAICQLHPNGTISRFNIMLFAVVVFFFFWVTGELSTLRQMMKVPNEPGLSPNNGLENAFLSDQSMHVT